MQQPLVIAILLGVISLSATWVIIYWHGATRGSWKDWPAGRSLMGLLGIISLGFGYGVVNSFLGNYEAKPVISFILYIAFIGAIIIIGLTIRKEMRRGKKRLNTRFPAHTGPVNVTVATSNNEEIPDE